MVCGCFCPGCKGQSGSVGTGRHQCHHWSIRQQRAGPGALTPLADCRAAVRPALASADRRVVTRSPCRPQRAKSGRMTWGRGGVSNRGRGVCPGVASAKGEGAVGGGGLWSVRWVMKNLGGRSGHCRANVAGRIWFRAPAIPGPRPVRFGPNMTSGRNSRPTNPDYKAVPRIFLKQGGIGKSALAVPQSSCCEVCLVPVRVPVFQLDMGSPVMPSNATWTHLLSQSLLKER